MLTFTDSSLRSDELLRTSSEKWQSTGKGKLKIINQKSKNHGKTRDLETGDSDTHHHPYGHRHEHRGGELYVGAFHDKKNSAIQTRITLFYLSDFSFLLTSA